jgi:hypothetical protein
MLSLALLAAAQGPAPNPNGDYGPPIVVTGTRDIVVNGRARHCRRLAGDPLNAVNANPPPGPRRESEIVPVGNGRFAFEQNMETVTGSDFWQRAGTGIDHYIFRAPPNGSPMCIGARGPDPEGFAQFRRIVDVAPYRGKRVRFTAWVASGNARLVRFWLAAGTARRLYNGGNTNNQPWGGDHGWTPVLLEMGPVADGAAHISYGFLLYGQGDVWVYHPRLEIVTDEPPGSRTDEVAIIGRDSH